MNEFIVFFCRVSTSPDCRENPFIWLRRRSRRHQIKDCNGKREIAPIATQLEKKREYSRSFYIKIYRYRLCKFRNRS